jgi:DNA repair photolyase
MNDPYQPVEEEYGLVGGALERLRRYGFGVHVITKSDTVLRDLDLLVAARRARLAAIVSMTITTMEDALAARLEPHAPRPSSRAAALAELSAAGIETRVVMMPILPFLEDGPEAIDAVVEAAKRAGASAVIAAYGVTLRDRQRAHFYRQLDRHFPGLSDRYRRRYGDRYGCDVPHAERLRTQVERSCHAAGIATRLPIAMEGPRSLPLWSGPAVSDET